MAALWHRCASWWSSLPLHWRSLRATFFQWLSCKIMIERVSTILDLQLPQSLLTTTTKQLNQHSAVKPTMFSPSALWCVGCKVLAAFQNFHLSNQQRVDDIDHLLLQMGPTLLCIPSLSLFTCSTGTYIVSWFQTLDAPCSYGCVRSRMRVEQNFTVK